MLAHHGQRTGATTSTGNQDEAEITATITRVYHYLSCTKCIGVDIIPFVPTTAMLLLSTKR
jgi:hypothetical protein